jgi:hypothetical protein
MPLLAAVEEDEHGDSVAVGLVGVGVLADEIQNLAAQPLEPRRRQPHRHPGRLDDRVRTSLIELDADRVEHRPKYDPALAGVLYIKPPGLARRSVGLLGCPPWTSAPLVLSQKSGRDQSPDMMQDGARMQTETGCQLFVSQRLVQAKPKDAQTNRVRQGPSLFEGGGPPFGGH